MNTSSVTSLHEAKAKRSTPSNFPDPIPLDQVERILRLGAKDRFSYAQLLYARRSVEYWAMTNGKQRRDWPMVIVNAARLGWGLRGYERWRTESRLPEFADRKLTASFVPEVLRHILGQRE